MNIKRVLFFIILGIFLIQTICYTQDLQPGVIRPKGPVAENCPVFEWTAVNGATDYWLIVADGSDISESNWLINVTVNSTYYQDCTVNFEENKWYYWKVKSVFNGVGGEWSEITGFIIQFDSLKPHVIAPLGEISDTRPVFQWEPVSGATTYWLLVGTSPDFDHNPSLINISTENTAYQDPGITFERDILYYWKVKSVFNGVGGAWSDIVSFIIPTAGPTPDPTPVPGLLSVEITGPLEGATLKDTALIETSTSNSVAKVDFYIDSVNVYSDETFPFEYQWDTTINHLPASNHSMDFGYYFVEWKDPATFDACRAEVNGYTNLYYASLASYTTDSPEQWIPLLSRSLENAEAENRTIHLNLELDSPLFASYLDAVLETCAPFWDSIVRIELADEPAWTRAELEQWIQTVSDKITIMGLSLPPQGFGVVYVYNQDLPDSKNARGLDWIGIEAYLDAPGDPVSQNNINLLYQTVERQMNQVPAGKSMVLITMAYARNGAWIDMDTLRDLQVPTYLIAHDNPRVLSIHMFAYTRATGTRDHPELKTSHRMIGDRLLNISDSFPENGLHTISVIAYDANGNTAMDRVAVSVENGTLTQEPTTPSTPFPTIMPTPEPTPSPVETPVPTIVPTPEPTPEPTSTPDLTPVPTEFSQDLDGDGINDTLEDTLMRRFAPYVRLYTNDDTRPCSAEWYIGRVTMRYHRSGWFDSEILKPYKVTVENITEQTKSDQYSNYNTYRSNFFLQIPNDSNELTTRKGQPSSGWKTYSHIRWSPDGGGKYDIQYWFFYAYNGKLGSLNHIAHEGDFEHVTVRVNSDLTTVDKIYYSAHNGEGRWYSPLCIHFIGSRPVVYSAYHSHADYPIAGEWARKGGNLDTLLPNDFTNDGDLWDCARNVVNMGEYKRPLNSLNWLNYSGRWGEIGDSWNPLINDTTSGPYGPTFKRKNNEDPWERNCSGNPEYDGFHAKVIRHTIPEKMNPGQTYNVSITMLNNGARTWTRGEGVRLASQRRNRDFSFMSKQLESSDVINTGQTKTFDFQLTAPNERNKVYIIDFTMIRGLSFDHTDDTKKPFGESLARKITITNINDYEAEFVSSTIPSTMNCGQTYTVSVTMRNKGAKIWTREDDFNLGSPDGDLFAHDRQAIPAGVRVGYDQEVTFNFTMKAPAQPGDYRTDWRMVHDNWFLSFDRWFGDTRVFNIHVQNPAGYTLTVQYYDSSSQYQTTTHRGVTENSSITISTVPTRVVGHPNYYQVTLYFLRWEVYGNATIDDSASPYTKVRNVRSNSTVFAQYGIPITPTPVPTQTPAPTIPTYTLTVQYYDSSSQYQTTTHRGVMENSVVTISTAPTRVVGHPNYYQVTLYFLRWEVYGNAAIDDPASPYTKVRNVRSNSTIFAQYGIPITPTPAPTQTPVPTIPTYTLTVQYYDSSGQSQTATHRGVTENSAITISTAPTRVVG
ncbi:MAG: Vps62-related protein, partial [Spirochaetales bacterium]|nr:Vps62-related protein [Spirochaetales bacterium]